ncbi:MAG: nucleotide sugar dehydrogenase [Candidatus Eremiobacteraeota bacterium]|nr:nucleotide sugar dehydrogenase [Candidatus Eremiobacteraeota bacterium]MBV8655811.1 nucleotide sugar dehydrogenase [Candidatus Eremiobacteraeota bacterium]
MPLRLSGLKKKILDRSAVIGVAGIGYVGLPLAVEKAKVGFTVIGYDRNPIRVDELNQGLNYIKDVNDRELAQVVDSGRLSATTDFGSIGRCDVVIICVPTPLTPNLDPDISYIRAVAELVAQQLRPGQLVCLESTTYPGTTNEVLLPIMERTGLRVGEDFFLCFSPERVDPGNARYTTKNTNKVVGGVTPACLEAGMTLYEQTILHVLPVSSPKVAELTKVFENTFRAVNIAMVNEMAMLCDRLGIDIWEVVEAAATKPFGIMRFDPGPGVGGHCIPLDPFYLAWKAREFDFRVRFIELAGEINVGMPYFVREKVVRALNQRGKAIKGAEIFVLGVAYKRDVDDHRESPAVKVMELLLRDGARIDYHDPHVPSFTDDRGNAWHSIPLSKEMLERADCTLVLTDHSAVDYERVVNWGRLVLDTRNATRAARQHLNGRSRDNVVLL